MATDTKTTDAKAAGDKTLSVSTTKTLTLKPRSGPLLGLDFFVLRWAGDLVSFLLDSVVSVEVRGTFDKPEVK